jgi:hypothetical protein
MRCASFLACSAYSFGGAGLPPSRFRRFGGSDEVLAEADVPAPESFLRHIGSPVSRLPD